MKTDLSKGNDLLLLLEYRVFISNRYQREVKEPCNAGSMRNKDQCSHKVACVCKGNVRAT